MHGLENARLKCAENVDIRFYKQEEIMQVVKFVGPDRYGSGMIEILVLVQAEDDVSAKIAELQQVVESIKVEWDYVSYDTRSIVMEACSRVLSDMEYQLIYYNPNNLIEI